MKYSRSIDYLVPAIFYLGTNEGWWARSANNMAHELSLDEARLLDVLQGFPSIFRKSLTTDPDHGGHYFSLQARYALRRGSDLGEAERVIDVPPLSREQLKMVLDFVQQSAESERLTGRTLLTGSISSFAALVAAGAAITAALMKPQAVAPAPCLAVPASVTLPRVQPAPVVAPGRQVTSSGKQ